MHLIRVKILAVQGLSLEQQVIEGQGKEGLDFSAAPVVTYGIGVYRVGGDHPWLYLAHKQLIFKEFRDANDNLAGIFVNPGAITWLTGYIYAY